MNHVDKPVSFDPEALRRKVSEISVAAPGENQDANSPVELNPLARKIAAQFRVDTYSPSMIIGLLRLLEFCALLAVGYAIHLAYVSSPGLDMTVFYLSVLFGGSAAGVLLLQLAAVAVGRGGLEKLERCQVFILFYFQKQDLYEKIKV